MEDNEEEIRGGIYFSGTANSKYAAEDKKVGSAFEIRETNTRGNSHIISHGGFLWTKIVVGT